MQTLNVDGFEYSPHHLSARAEVLAATVHARQARAAGRDPGLAQVWIMDMLYVIEEQTAGRHRVIWGACTCGLVTDDVRTLGGHLDLTTLEPARTYAIVDDEGEAVACQACLSIQEVPTKGSVRTVPDHVCQSPCGIVPWEL